MISAQTAQKGIGLFLLIGTLVSASLVLIGGIEYLIYAGHLSFQQEALVNQTSTISISEIWRFAFSGTPLGTVQLGLLLLIATQTLRVALLFIYYSLVGDYRFSVISLFILFVLVYSSFYRS